MACADLRHRGYLCDRITHQEVMAHSGTKFLGNLVAGDYSLLWISTPSDWYMRTPGKRAGPHWERIRNWLVKARALRMRVVLFGPPGYMWRMTPIRDALEDMNMHVVRMRLCHFGIKYDKRGDMPSGTYIQVASTYPIPTTLWRCRCKDHTQHVLDWYGQDAQHAEWRDKTLRIMIQRFLDQALTRKPKFINGNVYLNVFTRTDHNVQSYRTTAQNGPKWDTVVRRVTYDLDKQVVVQDIKVKDQPTGYDWHAPLPQGVRNISTRLYWEPIEPETETMLGTERPQSKKARKPITGVILDDYSSPSPTCDCEGDLPPVPNFPILNDAETPAETPPSTGACAFPTEARIKQKERLKADKEAGIKPKKQKKHVEPGNDDCGDDLRGLGETTITLAEDADHDELDSDDDVF